MSLLIEVVGPAVGMTTTAVRLGFWLNRRQIVKPTKQEEGELARDAQADRLGTRYAKGDLTLDQLDLELDYLYGTKERPPDERDLRNIFPSYPSFGSGSVVYSSAMVSGALPPKLIKEIEEEIGMGTSSERR